MTSFTCPFCRKIASISCSDYSYHNISFQRDVLDKATTPHLSVRIFRCPDENCRKETVIAYGMNGYAENRVVNIFPPSCAKIYPNYVPAAIREDYQEACAIVQQSPKAAATLARRCLQGMIRDFWGIQEGTLFAEVQKLKEKVPATQWAAIDALRKIGNIGAHMKKDVNVIVDVDKKEADQLIQLIELLIEKWYIARHDEEELYRSITKSSWSKSACPQ